MIVPFLNLTAAYHEIRDEIENAMLSCTRSGQYIGGDEVQKFEDEFASFVGANYCVTVGNGLDALIIALMAENIGPGHEVIVPAHTFIATWLAVSRVGGKIVPVDVDPFTYNIDVDKITASINEKTKAIIPVHLYGHPAELEKIAQIAEKFNLSVIEDAAQAHGASYGSRKIGSHSKSICWSFYPGKNLGALGDGGAITTNNLETAQRLRLLRNYGSSEKYNHRLLGMNSRLDPVQAAVLRVKLKYLVSWNKKRKEIAKIYLDELDMTSLGLPRCAERIEHAWHLFCVKTNFREQFRQALHRKGIETLIHYPVPPYRQEAYRFLNFKSSDYAVTENISEKLVSLPMCPTMTDDQVEFVLKSVKETLAS